MSYTKGPWATNADQHYEEGRPWIVWGPDGPFSGLVAHVAPYCPPYPGHSDYLRKAADASLIAAAPDLFGKRNLENPKYDGYFEAAREAIAKAKGENVEKGDRRVR